MRPPGSGDLLHFGRFWKLSEAVCDLDGFADAEVPGREHVRPALGEDEEHMRGPDSDAFHLRECLYYLFVRSFREVLKSHDAVARLARQVANVLRLLAGQTH